MYTVLQFAPDRGGSENGHLRDCNQKGLLALPSLSVHHARYEMTIEKCLPHACTRTEAWICTMDNGLIACNCDFASLIGVSQNRDSTVAVPGAQASRATNAGIASKNRSRAQSWGPRARGGCGRDGDLAAAVARAYGSRCGGRAFGSGGWPRCRCRLMGCSMSPAQS
jgi:hypothetical protein